MPATFENLRILQAAEAIADAIWKHVSQWDEFARDVVGKQLARAADSVGANIAESFGRFNFGEKLQFLYYSRGAKTQLRAVRESSVEYLAVNLDEFPEPLFAEPDLTWLSA